jgi:hypothetical protein
MATFTRPNQRSSPAEQMQKVTAEDLHHVELLTADAPASI